MKTYTGGCHCQEVRFEVAMTIEKALACNCSICSKRATLLVFTPEENFKLLSGASNLTEYQFGKKRLHHFFCSKCGIAPFSSGAMPNGAKMKAINLRCVDSLNLDEIPVEFFDGKNH